MVTFCVRFSHEMPHALPCQRLRCSILYVKRSRGQKLKNNLKRTLPSWTKQTNVSMLLNGMAKLPWTV
jgi:hypothetical protein